MTASFLNHVRHALRRIGQLALAGLALVPSLAIEQELPVDYRMNEQIIMVPAGTKLKARLQTTVFRPNGPGPFPLLIINHGKEPGPPRDQARDRFFYMARAFIKRGYAVMVPMRQGFAGSTGRYQDHGCNMAANGYAQAKDIRDAIEYAREQEWVDEDRIVVVGQSYGGLASVALGTEELPGVRGVVNFAGGLRDDDPRCDWRAKLVEAFDEYGILNRTPTLWMYGANDSLFDPALAQRMFGAFQEGGGQGQLIRLPAFKRDAHGLLASRDGEQQWWGPMQQFLEQIGMPTREIYAVNDLPALPRSTYAKVDDVTAVPFLSESGRAAYRDYLGKLTPRAFAVSASGAWCWAEEGEAPEARALAACSSKSDSPCQLYSVDDYVVWDGSAGSGPDASALAHVQPPAEHLSAVPASSASASGSSERARSSP
jgi:dienelactone hydrolase